MTALATIDHFERLAPEYARLRRTWPLSVLQDAEERAVRALAQITPGARVLDAGCGGGQTLAWLRQRGAVAIGIDRTRGMASSCRRAGFLVSVQDMELPALTATFDWVLCVGSLEFTTDPLAALRGFAACLRDGGQLVLLFPRRNWLGAVYTAYHRRHNVHIHRFSRRHMRSLLTQAQLQPSAWRRTPLADVCRAELMR